MASGHLLRCEGKARQIRSLRPKITLRKQLIAITCSGRRGCLGGVGERRAIGDLGPEIIGNSVTQNGLLDRNNYNYNNNNNSDNSSSSNNNNNNHEPAGYSPTSADAASKISRSMPRAPTRDTASGRGAAVESPPAGPEPAAAAAVVARGRTS